MTITSTDIDRFFDRYSAALLARDADTIATLYAVPSLILFPGQSIAVDDAQQTAEFFASSWPQYEGIDDIQRTTTTMGTGPGSVWVDVTWTYGGSPREHFCYQLIDGANGPQIAVLTLLG
jgi:hypothetical protein